MILSKNTDTSVFSSKITHFGRIVAKDFRRNKYLYLLVIPVIMFYLVFHYAPMYGASIAFKRFSPKLGILGSEWVGLKYFKDFISSYYFWRVLRNTILINVYELIFAFPAPILLALLINEVKNKYFKNVVQSISYIPHFISIVIICGMIIDFCSTDGIINDLLVSLGAERSPLLMEPSLFRTIFVSTGVWQGIGWGSIIYLAALSSIDQELYEAAAIDGIGRLKQVWYITLPSILPTIIILLILNMGKMMNVGFEKVFLLYNARTYETADVISTFVFRRGILEANFSYSTAVGLFNSVINFSLVLLSNKIAATVSDTSLW